MEHACRDCRSTFTITEVERKFFVDRDLALPKRCRRCRALRKARARQADVQRAAEVLGVVWAEVSSLTALLDE